MAEWAWGGWALSFQAANAQDEESETNQRELRQHEADPLDGYKLPDNVKRLQQMEWPLFPTPTLASLQVSGYEMYNNSLYYTVTIEMNGGFKWTILKSYEEFSQLHKILMQSYNGIDKSLFPHRKMFGSHKLENITEMQSRLNQYLSSVLKYFMLPPPQILQFLEYRFSDILSITQTLSALFYDRGEEFLDTNSMVAFSPLQLHCVCQRLILPIESDLQSVKEDFGHLLDFLQQLKKIKVCHPKRRVFRLASDVKLKFDLSIMKSLDTLVLQNIDLELIERFGNIPDRLTTLATHGGLNAMRDILKHTSLLGDKDVNWPMLKVIDFSENEISTIDSSLWLAHDIEVLNLSNNSVKDIDNLSELPLLRILDLSGNKIESLRDLHRRLGNITTLCLARNSLRSLQGLEKCYSIVCLDIQSNRLTKTTDLAPLSSLPLLEQLMIKGNPFTEVPFYRQNVFGLLLLSAAQLAVDGKPASRDELKVCQSLAHDESAKKAQKAKTKKKVTTRKVSIKGEDEDEALVVSKMENEEIISSTGTRRSIEEMRKEGGENWLSLLNQHQPQASPVVIHKKKRNKSKKAKKKTRVQVNIASPGSSSGADIESSSDHLRVQEPLVVSGPASGLPSPHLLQLLGSRECSSPWSCSATVTECKANLPSLTHQEMDDLVMTEDMEPCVVMVDVGLGRITEDFVLPGTAGKNRNTRDLTFLRGVRVHEGHILAVAIELSTIVTSSSWILYGLKDYPSLADMYSLLSRKLKLVDDISVPSPVLLAKQISQPQELDHMTSEPDKATLRQGVENVDALQQENDLIQFNDPEEDKKQFVLSLKERRQRYKGTVKRPSIENEEFQKFLMKKVVRDSSEVIMYVLWCGICLPGTSPHQVEGGVVISNESIYLLEVKGYQKWTWEGNMVPLFPLASMKLEHLSRVNIKGMFNHSLYVEVHQGLPITSFVVFCVNSEKCHQLVVQLHAALDATNLFYKTMDALDVKKMKKTSGIVFVSPDHYSGNRLKEWLSHERTNVHLANFVSTQMDKKVVGMYEVELQQSCKELAKSFDIEQYLVVTSVEPSERCKLHTLILAVTKTDMFLYEEAFISGPGLRSTPAKYLFPPLSIVHQQKITSIKSISFCNTRQFVHSPSDPMHQVAIQFVDHVGMPWYFCARDFNSLQQTLKYIKQQWNMLLSNSLPLVEEMDTPLPYFDNLTDVPVSSPKPEHGHKSGVPILVKSTPLLQFNSLPNWKKNEQFNEHISLANYLKKDETIVTSSLVYCAPSDDSKFEIESCVIISNYAVYLISDMDSVRRWLDAGGISSFSRMSLLNPDTEYPLQCYYRMWVSDIRKIEVNHLALSITLHEVRAKVSVHIITCNFQVTASFVTALANRINIVSGDREKTDLQDYVDITDDPFGDEDGDEIDPSPPSPSTVRPSVELSLADKASTKLKLHLVESQPDVARGSSILKCSESMRIISSQIMLLAEQLRVRESMLLHYRPHLVLLTNYGLFLCNHASLPNNTPCLLMDKPSNISVKKWARTNDILSVRVITDPVHNVPQVLVSVKVPAQPNSQTQLCLYPLTAILGYIFVNQLKLIWTERTGQALQTDYML